MAGVATFGMPETYQGVLLKRKAAKLRQETGNDKYWHPHEKQTMNVHNIVTKYISRPVR